MCEITGDEKLWIDDRKRNDGVKTKQDYKRQQMVSVEAAHQGEETA